MLSLCLNYSSPNTCFGIYTMASKTTPYKIIILQNWQLVRHTASVSPWLQTTKTCSNKSLKMSWKRPWKAWVIEGLMESTPQAILQSSIQFRDRTLFASCNLIINYQHTDDHHPHRTRPPCEGNDPSFNVHIGQRKLTMPLWMWQDSNILRYKSYKQNNQNTSTHSGGHYSSHVFSITVLASIRELLRNDPREFCCLEGRHWLHLEV